MNLTNCTRVAEFILVGLPTVWGMENMIFACVSLLYLLCLMSNVLIIVMVVVDPHLQKPMYFFLSNLSCIDIRKTTSFIPKLLVNYLSARNSICFNCCMTQMFFYFLCGTTEFFTITLISLDLAICHPLRYSTILTSDVCLKLTVSAWFGGFFSILSQEILIVNLPFCASNVINHFFCDVGPVLKIAGGIIHIVELLDFLFAAVMVMSSIIFTFISYLFIISTILRMSSTTKQQRAFSTCASHLVVVCIFYGSMLFVYLRPSVKNSSLRSVKYVSWLHTIMAPMLNPFIYTIRNNEVKEAVQKAFKKKILAFCKM